jgi:cellobiose phosphorylase
MKFGYFDDAKREYVITRPDTPLPWINYLGCQAYFGIISNTAGGYSFYRDARLRRITRYRYNNVPFDFGGRYIYLRDDDSASSGRRAGSPRATELEDYTCRHGMGYSIIGSKLQGIEAHTRYFVPLDENLEIWQLTVTNHRATKARALVSPASSSACGTRRTIRPTSSATSAPARWSRRRRDLPQDRIPRAPRSLRVLRLLGAAGRLRHAARGLPRALSRLGQARRPWSAAVSTNSIAHGWAPIGAHHVKLSLEPGETRQIVFVLGYHENPGTRSSIRPARRSSTKRR